MTTVEKPSNSPMLLASAASQSASSPASGGHTCGGPERFSDRRQGANIIESLESICAQRQLLNAMAGSTSAVDILKHANGSEQL